MQKQAELYRGKAKTVYSTENPDLLVLHSVLAALAASIPHFS